MRRIHLVTLLMLLLLRGGLPAQTLTLVTWNIQNMGRSKSDEQIEAMARILRHADLVAIQEVVAKDPAGAQAIGRLGEALRRTGAPWEYRVSDPTTGTPNQSERYAFLWRSDKATLLGHARLVESMADTIRREPYTARFQTAIGEMILVNFHAVPHNQQPEREIKIVRSLARTDDRIPVVFLADWNTVDHHTVFTPLLRQGYRFAVSKTPTSLKKSCSPQGEYRHHAIDNILIPPAFRIVQGDVYDFAGSCDNLIAARKISDHLPVWVRIAAAP